MKANRHVPLIFGVVSLAASLFLILADWGLWKLLPAALLLAFGVASLKTELFAGDNEILELTGERPIGEDTKKDFIDRL